MTACVMTEGKLYVQFFNRAGVHKFKVDKTRYCTSSVIQACIHAGVHICKMMASWTSFTSSKIHVCSDAGVQVCKNEILNERAEEEAPRGEAGRIYAWALKNDICDIRVSSVQSFNVAAVQVCTPEEVGLLSKSGARALLAQRCGISKVRVDGRWLLCYFPVYGHRANARKKNFMASAAVVRRDSAG